MFTSDVCESGQSEVTLKDVSAEALPELVRYVYEGEVHVTHENVESLMTAASMLQLDCLVEDLQTHMVDALTLDNCAEVRSEGREREGVGGVAGLSGGGPADSHGGRPHSGELC